VNRQEIRVTMVNGETLRNDEVSTMIYQDFLPAALAVGVYQAAPEPRVIGHGLRHKYRTLSSYFETGQVVPPQVVRPLRAVRQRLKAGPAPAPSEATGLLRRKLAQLEAEAEMIELDRLGSLIPGTGPQHPAADAAACAAAAIETVVTTRAGTALIDDDRGMIAAIAAAAQQVDAR